MVRERLGEGQDMVAAGRIGHVAVAGQRAVAPQLAVAGEVGQIDVEGAARGEVGRGGEAEQAALAVGRGLVADVEEGVAATAPSPD